VDLNAYLRIFRRRWQLIVLTVLVGVIAAVVATPADATKSVNYTATHRLQGQPFRLPSGENVNPSEQSLTSLAALITSRAVAEKAAAELGVQGDPSTLARGVRAVTDSKDLTITVTVTGTQRGAVITKADAFASALLKALDERSQEQKRVIVEEAQARMAQLQGELRQLDARIGTNAAGNSALVAQRAALGVEYQRQYQRVEIANSSTAAQALTSLGPATARKADGFSAPPTRTGRGLLAAGLGLPIGLALALIVERVDRRIRTKEVAEKAFGLPVLAEVPPMALSARRHDQVLTAERPASIVAEAYRNLRTSLTLMAGPRGVETGAVHHILVSSANPGEGKTTTATNLAAAFAEAGNHVLVLDCDFRHPRVGRYLGVEEGPGLSDALGGRRGTTRLSDVVVASDIPGVSVVTSGSPVVNPAELLARGHDVLQEATALADVVIFDTPPLLVINDASELLPLVDTVVLTCRSGRTTVEAAERVRDLLARLGGPVAGVVLVGSTEAPSSRGHYYYYSGDNLKDLPFWRRFGAARGARGPGRPQARKPAKRPAAPAPQRGAKPQAKGKHAGAKGRQQAEQPRRKGQQPRPANQPQPRQQAPAPAPPLAEPSRPRPAAPPAAPVGPPPAQAPRQAVPPPAPAPDAAFAPPPRGGGVTPEPTDLVPDPIALTDPDQTSVDAANPEDVSPSASPHSPR
jgi:capsular exopolysaccharide synthesis family protein